ncbi:MAG: membrane protein insertase YidC, partial [Undibacterium sp.]|nr:membrane protein insertase YidC [Undibacterium sp.]
MDIKRTVLWVIFAMSLLVLWDKWMQHNGKPSMFSPASTAVAIKKPDASASASSAVANAAQVASAPLVGSEAAQTAAFKGETITITTDLVKVDIDTLGGEIKRLELLKYADSENAKKNVVLFEKTAERTYAAQTGLLGGQFPNHNSAFTALPGTRVLGDANELSLVLEAEQAGVKLTKTFIFKKNDYVIGVKHTVTNNTMASIVPSLYLQLIHDGTKPKSGG